jgi:hypothetical protein
MIVARHRGVDNLSIRQEQPIPKKFSREIIVRVIGQMPDLAHRTVEEVVRAINITSLKMGAITMRYLPSGDTVVTFKEDK